MLPKKPLVVVMPLNILQLVTFAALIYSIARIMTGNEFCYPVIIMSAPLATFYNTVAVKTSSIKGHLQTGDLDGTMIIERCEIVLV